MAMNYKELANKLHKIINPKDGNGKPMPVSKETLDFSKAIVKLFGSAKILVGATTLGTATKATAPLCPFLPFIPGNLTGCIEGGVDLKKTDSVLSTLLSACTVTFRSVTGTDTATTVPGFFTNAKFRKGEIIGITGSAIAKQLTPSGGDSSYTAKVYQTIIDYVNKKADISADLPAAGVIPLKEGIIVPLPVPLPVGKIV